MAMNSGNCYICFPRLQLLNIQTTNIEASSGGCKWIEFDWASVHADVASPSNAVISSPPLSLSHDEFNLTRDLFAAMASK